MRKGLSILLAGIMVLAAVFYQGTPVYAATTFELKIEPANGVTDTVSRTYVAYQIFSGNASGTAGSKKLTDVGWGSGISDADAFVSMLKTYDNTLFGSCVSSSPDGVAKQLTAVSDTKRVDLAAAIGASGATWLKEASATGVYTTTTGVFKLPAGYYLIVETTAASALGQSARSRNILKVVGNATNASETIAPKRAVPTLTKMIIGSGGAEVTANVAGIGDEVKYKLKTTVPDMLGYDKYFFIIEEKMDKGLTLKENSFEITIKGDSIDETLIKNTGYKIADYDKSTNSFKIVFMNFVQYKNNEGAEIVVTYSALMNEKADVTNTGLTTGGDQNTAKLQYSNDPTYSYVGTDTPTTADSDHMGETVKQTVITYTTQLEIVKIDGANASTLKDVPFRICGVGIENAQVAEGTVYRKNESAATPYYLLKDGTFSTTNPGSSSPLYVSDAKYEKITDSDAIAGLQKVVTYGKTDDDGKLLFKGLTEGTYYLYEVSPPVGYNALSGPLEIKITKAIDESKTCTWDEKNLDPGNNSYSIAEKAIVLTIVNNQGATLPATGGIGTTIFYVLGGLLVCGAVVLMIARKRMSYEEHMTED